MSPAILLDMQPVHIVLFCYQAWGHARPLCNLIARVVKSRPVIVTFFLPDTFVDSVKKELLRSFDHDDEHLFTYIRLVGLSHGPNPLDQSVIEAGFATAYGKLVEGENVTCAHTGVKYPSTSHPNIAILDIYASPQLKAIRKLSRQPVTIYGWYAASAATFCAYYVPGIVGGKSDTLWRTESEVERTGRPLGEVAAEICSASDGSLIEVPGCPSMYDHELYPQNLPTDVGLLRETIALRVISAYSTIEECDGVIMTAVQSYEPEATEVISKMFAESSRSLYVMGPLLAPDPQEMAATAESPSEFKTFLDRVLETHGERSLVYISFGSLFWPSEPEKMWAILDVLMETNTPFILSHPSPWGVIPEDVVIKVKTYGLGLLSRWSPQQLILAHSVTAWFITHAGYNSVIESLSEGIPMICWPAQLDQPINAAYLSSQLNVAYELFEVRSGRGTRAVHRLGKAPLGTMEAVRREAKEVLEKAFGEDGHRKRENAQGLRDKFGRAWEKNGEARHEFESFLAAIPGVRA